MGSADEFERMLQSHLACRNAPPSGQSWRLPLLSLPQSLTHREAQTRGRSGMRDIRDESPADRASKRCRHDGRAESQERSRRLDPRQLTAHLSHAPGLPELLSLQSKHGGDFDGVHVGAFWSRFKTLARDELVGLSERLAPVCQQTVRMLPELNARAVANIAHALSKGGLVGAGSWERVWAALPEVVCRSLGEFNSQALANTVWAFAKSRQASPELFDAISAEAMRRGLADFNPQELSNTAWAFANAGHASLERFNLIAAEAVRRRLAGFNEQDLANTAWAFASAGHASRELFNAISAEAVRRRLGDFSQQHLSNTAWAFAEAGHKSPELFKAISAEAVRRRLFGFTEQDVSNTAWAFAKAGHKSPELFKAISAEAVRRQLGGFNEQDLSITAWAFAKAGHASPELFQAISAQAVRRLGRFNAQDLSNTAWAFANAGHASMAIFDAISAEAVRRGLGEFNPQELSNTAWAFAKAGHASSELFHAISAEAVRRRLVGFNAQHLSNIAWACAFADPPSADELFGTLAFTSRCAHFEAAFSIEDLRQLHQWSLWREERGERWPALPESLRHACLDAFIEEEGRPSQLQSDVVRYIRSRVGGMGGGRGVGGAQVREEYRCRASGYSIDALVTLSDGKKIAVEVDGPTHFLCHSQRPTGATLLKHRQLRYYGWRLESVPYWEWKRNKALHWLPREPN